MSNVESWWYDSLSSQGDLRMSQLTVYLRKWLVSNNFYILLFDITLQRKTTFIVIYRRVVNKKKNDDIKKNALTWRLQTRICTGAQIFIDCSHEPSRSPHLSNKISCIEIGILFLKLRCYLQTYQTYIPFFRLM